MRKHRSFSIIERVKSLSHAFRGLWDMIQTEHNAWIHALATVLVLGLSLWLGIGRIEFALVVVSILLVWTAETFNTVLEIIADLVIGDRYSRIVKRAKDVAAAAVLITVFGAIVIGLVILGPPLYSRLS